MRTMHVEAQVTSKGQVTLPKPIRDLLKLKKGSRVQFVVTQSGVQLRVVQKRSIMDWYGALSDKTPYEPWDKVKPKTREAIAAEVVREMSGH